MRYKSPYADLFKEQKPERVKTPKGVRARFEIALDSVADADILEKLETVGNKSDYVRNLIRQDIGTQ